MVALAVAAIMPVSAQGQSIQFGESQVMDYCRALNANNSDAWACRDGFRRDFDRVSHIYGTGDYSILTIIRPAIDACRARYFPQWNRVRYCAEDQVGPAMRLRDSAAAFGRHNETFVRACLTQFPDQLAVAEDCVQTLQRLRDRN